MASTNNKVTKSKSAVGIAEIRHAIADYMSSEGCSCCRAQQSHDRHAAVLAKLLKVPHYSDGSGYNFGKFETKAKRRTQ